mgnify:CR=1 FL=1
MVTERTAGDGWDLIYVAAKLVCPPSSLPSHFETKRQPPYQSPIAASSSA